MLLIFSFTLYADCANAQKISIKKGIAYADDSAYCKVSGKTGFAGSMETSFSIAGMDDTELIFVKENPEDGVYEFSFLSFNERIKINKLEFGSAWKTNIVKELFKNKVISGNNINGAGKNRFILKFKSDEKRNNDVEPRNADSQFKLEDRNKSADIFIFGNEIKQDFKLIGTFTVKTGVNQNAEIIRTYIIKLPNDEKIAEFKMNEFKPEDNSLYMFRNDRTVTVRGLSSVIVGNDVIMKKVAEVLIENRSL